jgi:hypothetical protein
MFIFFSVSKFVFCRVLMSVKLDAYLMLDVLDKQYTFHLQPVYYTYLYMYKGFFESLLYNPRVSLMTSMVSLPYRKIHINKDKCYAQKEVDI